MAEELKKVQAGEPFQPSVALQHATIDTVRYVQELQRTGGLGTAGGAGNNSGVCLVKNNSGIDRDRFNVLGLGSNAFPTPTDNLAGFKAGPVLYGVTPATASHLGKFAILLAPAKDGKIVPALVSGIGVVQVNVTDTGHTFADVKDGDAASLASAETGSAKILWVESGTGVKWAVVHIGPAQTQAFIIKAQVNESGNVATTDATFDIDNVSVMWPPGGELATTPTTVNNLLGFPAADDADVIAFYNQATGEWEGVPAIRTGAC